MAKRFDRIEDYKLGMIVSGGAYNFSVRVIVPYEEYVELNGEPIDDLTKNVLFLKTRDGSILPYFASENHFPLVLEKDEARDRLESELERLTADIEADKKFLSTLD